MPGRHRPHKMMALVKVPSGLYSFRTCPSRAGRKPMNNMLNLPIHISLIFELTTLLAVFLIFKAANYSKRTLLVLLAWLVLQTSVAISGFYTKTNVLPPRCVWLFWPPMMLITALFWLAEGKSYLDRLDLGILTILHGLRMLTALTFYWLFIHKAVPEILTFKGRNLDFLAGLTSPAVYYFGFVKKAVDKRILLFWNLVGLGLLVHLVVNAILSGPFPFQQFAFDQPGIAFLYFPFVWMPCCVVPIFLLAHLASLRQLLVGKTK
jgi:hypothetical protein